MLNPRDVQASNAVVTGTLTICSSQVMVLFELGGQQLPIVRLVATPTLEDVGDKVLALGVASQVI